MPLCCSTRHHLDDSTESSLATREFATTSVTSQNGSGNGAEFTISGGKFHYRPNLTLEPCHMVINLDVDLDHRKVIGSVIITLVSQSDNPDKTRVVTLNAMHFEQIVAVTCATNAIASYEYNDEVLEIKFGNPIAKGDKVDVMVDYVVVNPETGMIFNVPDSIHPQRARHMCTDHETERAQYWLPCIDHPSVRTTLDFHITAEKGLTVLANGEFKGEAAVMDNPMKVVTSWSLNFPCPSYLICVAVGEYLEVVAESHNGIPVKAYAPKALYKAEDVARTFGRTTEMLNWMTAKLNVPLPWPKYYQVVYNGPSGAAMENISLVAWDDLCIQDDVMAEERGWLIDLTNVHEMGHTYFGDAVVMNHFSHAWLKESWASYIETCWLEHKMGLDVADCFMWMERNFYMAEADERYVRPIVTHRFDFSWDLFDSHLYPGGAWRIHMLRRMMGEAQFWAGVQLYLKENIGKLVETHDFQKALEKSSGLSLQRFFDQWIFSSGYPILKVSVGYNSDKEECVITLKQTQVNWNRGIYLFDLSITLAIEVEEGVWQTRVVSLCSDKHDGTGSTAIGGLKKKPLQVVVDPDAHMLCKVDMDADITMLTRMLTHPRSVWGKLIGAELLAKQASRKSVDVLVTAYKSETLWIVRRLFAEQLSKIASGKAIHALCELFECEKDPRVLGVLAMKMSTIRDNAIGATLHRFVEDSNAQTPRATLAFALTGLGVQRDPKYESVLIKFAMDDSLNPWWAWVKRGAINGLAELRTEEAMNTLLKLAPDGAIPYFSGLRATRVAVMFALGNVCYWMNQQTRDRVAFGLAQILRDDHDYFVRKAAASALSNLGDTTHAYKALELFKKSVAVNQDQFVAERNLRRASGIDDRNRDAIGELKKAVEDIRAELRTAKDKLEDFEMNNEREKDKEKAAREAEKTRVVE